MDCIYEIPHRKKLGEAIDKVCSQLKENIQAKLNNAVAISLCADIWSKPGMSASFLGVTAHFFTLNSNKRHSICIALKRFPSPHNGTRITELLQNIVDRWELPRKSCLEC
uniref:HAT C-terminal dimerisation domain-containing protein n=1 Tax=Amphimedon queenslandica TaxID=400682 RepID=A0A1X7UUV6_AMPQE